MAELEKQGSALAGMTLEGNDFAALLKKEFKPKTDEAKSAVEQAVQTLAQQALSNTKIISGDAVRSIEAMSAALDKKLTEQVNKIIHHEDFQKLESAWRGLHYLVNNTESDEMLKIRVMNFDYATVQTNVAALFGSNQDIGKGIADILVDKLVNDGVYSVIERKQLDKILAEQNFSNSDRADPASAAKIARILGVDAIIV